MLNFSHYDGSTTILEIINLDYYYGSICGVGKDPSCMCTGIE